MKTITAIFFLMPLLASGQDIISRTTSIQNANGLFYLADSTLFDNGTALPGLSFSRRLIGDTSAVARYLKEQATGGQLALAKDMALAMRRRQANQDFNAYRAIYNQATGREMYTHIEEELLGTYQGRYRVHDLQADSSFTAHLVRVGADRRYRLEHDSTGQRWPVLPLSERSFRIVGWQGANYDMYWDGENNKRGELRAYHPVAKIEGSPPLRIVKISNQ